MSERRPRALACVLLVLLTGTAYVRTFGNGFVKFDDGGYVADNAAVKAGLTAESIKYAFTTFDMGNWTPLTWLSYELNVSLFGVNAAALHAVDLLLHMSNVVLLFLLLLRMTGRFGPSAVIAAIFAVHPLHVESVAWIGERKDVLSMFFLLISLLCYERYAARPGWGWYGACYAAFLCGLLSKPMVVTLPLLLLIMDFWPLARSPGMASPDPARTHPFRPWLSLLLEKVPFLLTSFVFGLVAIAAQRDSEAVLDPEVYPWSLKLLNVIDSYGWYLGKTLLPTSLCHFYTLSYTSMLGWHLYAGAAALVGVSVWVGMNFRRRPYLLFGWLWFLVSLLPVIGIMHVGAQSRADRYTYIPHIGLLTMLVFEADFRLSRLPRAQVWKLGLTGCTLTCLTVLCFQQVRFWHDPETLWRHALASDSQNWIAHYHLGRQRLEAGRLDEALPYFQKALEIRPRLADAHVFVGTILLSKGDLAQAEAAYLQALKFNPDLHTALSSMGTLRLAQGRLPEAEQFLVRALKAEKGQEDAYVCKQLGMVYAQQGKFPGALKQFQDAIRLKPNDPQAHKYAAAMLMELGRPTDAIDQLRQAVQLNPGDAANHIVLGELLAEQGDRQGARRHYLEALKINPQDEQVRARLAILERAAGQSAPAPQGKPD